MSGVPSPQVREGQREGGAAPLHDFKQDEWRLDLVEHLKNHLFFQNILKVLRGRVLSLDEIQGELEDDKKLLTFSDSVQDAAHRAGFFEARTFQFNFRSAIQQFLISEGMELTLKNLPEAFIRYWAKIRPESTFIATFLPPDMAWFRDFEYLKTSGHLPEGSHLSQDLHQRLSWEICSEYGFRARIGRTLEKSGSSIAHPEPILLGKAMERLLEIVQNAMGELRNLDQKTLGSFLVGLLTHLKNQGALMHPALESYIEKWGGTFLHIGKPWMPNFGFHIRSPIFLTTKDTKRFDLLLGTGSKYNTWYQSWAEKCFLIISNHR